MKKLLLITAVCCVFATTSMADQLLKEILGNWCKMGDATTFYTKQDKCFTIQIEPNRLIEAEEDTCEFKSITTRYETNSWVEGTKLVTKRNPVYEVKASCAGEGDRWNTTDFFYFDSLSRHLNIKSYLDNELPAEYQTTFDFCSNNKSNCGQKLVFKKDRVDLIVNNGEGAGFCRYTLVTNVWDNKHVTATKSMGGVVTHVTALCPQGVKRFRLFQSKGSVYVREVVK
jgi:hypothetical protein